MPDTEDAQFTQARSLVPLGYALGGLSLVAFAALLHHPVGHGAISRDLFTSIRSQTGADQIVHGTLAIVFGLLTSVMYVFVSRLGLSRLTVVLGMVAFACGLLLTVLAAIDDGFVVPAIVAGCGATPSAPCSTEAFVLLRMNGLQIEFLTRFSFVAIAIAVTSWSVALLSTPSLPRWAGIAGLASAAAQIVALAVTTPRLSVHNLPPIFAAQVAWYLLAAVLMIRRRAPFAE